MEQPIRIAICGALGRMGREVTDEAAANAAFEIAALVERPNHPGVGVSVHGLEVIADGATLPAGIDVVIDFSAPAAVARRAAACAEAGIALVTGVTGLADAEIVAIGRAGGRIPVFLAPNMSLGVALLARLAHEAARALPDFDVEIVEMHHRAKKDAPSGTAAALAREVEEARPGLRRVHGREGLVGPRDPHEIGIHALRGGDVVGEHTVVFAGDGERIELTHRAGSRRTFAAGALRAARFVSGRAPGIYGMDDLLADGHGGKTDG